MNAPLAPGVREVLDAVHYRPGVSIIMPFHTRLGLVNELNFSLKIAVEKVSRELSLSYPPDICSLMAHKLQRIIKSLLPDKTRKSVAIFASPVFEKVLYLDVSVEEKIIIDESFEIRDLLYCKQLVNKFLVLELDGKQGKLSLYDGRRFAPVQTSKPTSVYAYLNEVPERVSNFEDASARRQVIMEKYLRQLDEVLGDVLQFYHLPVLVVGPARLIGHFSEITHNGRAIASYIHPQAGNDSLLEIDRILQPHIQNFKTGQVQQLLHTLEESTSRQRLATGIHEVWRQASKRNAKLLVVESNFMYAAVRGSTEDEIEKPVEPVNKLALVIDAVDDVIEMVLKAGGEIRFVDKDVLEKYDRIALVQYY
jgi:hypothetical protein